jgi:hypothetical protein
MIPCGRGFAVDSPGANFTQSLPPARSRWSGSSRLRRRMRNPDRGGQQDGLSALGHGQIFVSGRNR